MVTSVPFQVEKGVSPGRPLQAAQLVEELLNGDRGTVPAAFEAFSLAGPSFVAENQGLVERAWLKAAGLDDWPAFQRAYVSEVSGPHHRVIFLHLFCQEVALLANNQALASGFQFAILVPMEEAAAWQLLRSVGRHGSYSFVFALGDVRQHAGI